MTQPAMHLVIDIADARPTGNQVRLGGLALNLAPELLGRLAALRSTPAKRIEIRAAFDGACWKVEAVAASPAPSKPRVLGLVRAAPSSHGLGASAKHADASFPDIPF